MSSPTQWFVKSKNGASGPFTSAQLKAFADNGKLPRDAQVSRSAEGPWTQAQMVKGLFAEVEAEYEPKASDLVPDAVKNSVSAIGSAVGGLSKSLISKVQTQLTAPKSEPPPIKATIVARVEDSANSLIARLTRDGQDEAFVQKMSARVGEIMTTGEEILYLAVQAKPMMNFSPDCVALTTKRFIIYRTKMLGKVEFFDCAWKNCGDVHMKENMIGAEISFKTKDGRIETIDYLPKPQARQVYRLAQEQEDAAVQMRRNMALEELQAGADKTVINQAIGAMPMHAPQPVAEDPLAKMSKLKSLLDNGLITQEEFDAKRKQVLDSI